MEHIYNLEEQMDLICSLLLKTEEELGLAFSLKVLIQNIINYWAAFDVPRHLYHFNQNSIENFFLDKGLRLVKTKPMLFDAFYVSILSERLKENKLSFLEEY